MKQILTSILLLTALCAATRAEAAPTRFALLIGNNRGASDEADLSYAESDAEKMHNVLRDLGGFNPQSMILLRGKNAVDVRSALRQMVERIRGTEGDSILLVYYSGHADARALHLGDSELDISTLESDVTDSRATVKLLVLDSCRSGTVTKVKGGQAVEPFAIMLDEPVRGRGAIFLTSSSMNEDAQESETLRGSFFTHYLVSGLMGAADRDGDGKVGLIEAYRHAYDHTVRASSRTQRGIQHPTFRYDLRGKDDLVLTAPGAATPQRGTLGFPGNMTYLVLRGGRDGNVVGEITAQDKSRVLNVAAGKYFIIGRGTRHLLEGEIRVGAGQSLVVDDDKLDRYEYARLLRKGGPAAAVNMAPSLVHGVEAGYRFATSIASGVDGCHGIYAGYSLDLSAVTVGGRVSGCHAISPLGNGTATIDAFNVEVRAMRAADIWRVQAAIGGVFGAGLWRESVTEKNWFGVSTIGPAVSLDFDVGWGFLVGGDVTVPYYFWVDTADTEEVIRDRAFGANVTFGVSKQW